VSVATEQRFRNASSPCPVCGGWDSMPRGQGKRCSGFRSDDGAFIHCTRAEQAGSIEPSDADPPTYAHRAAGPCKCGQEHGYQAPRQEPEATFDYQDVDGSLLFQVVRFPGKQFRQRRPDRAGGWVWKLEGVRRVLYRLPELLAADASKPVYVVEGERDVETLCAMGLTATTTSGGASNWRHTADHARQYLANRDVIIIRDKDAPGLKYATDAEQSLRDVVLSLKTLECPATKDVTDHIAAGGTLVELVETQREPCSLETSEAPPVWLDDETQAAGEPAGREESWASLVKSVPASWYNERPPVHEWLLRDARHAKVPGVLPLGKVGQLIAEGGAAKTMVAFQLAVAVATGARWLGCFSVPNPGRVLLVCGEEDAEECQRRVYHATAVNGTKAPAADAIEVLPLHAVSCAMLELSDTGNLCETAFLVWLRGYVKNGNFRLLVIDPLSRFAGPNAEIDNAAATRFIQALESLAAPDRVVLNTHHTPVASRGTGAEPVRGRGSSAFVDGARWQAALSVERLKFDDTDERERLGEIVTFAVTKSNYARKPEPVALRRSRDHGGALVPLDEHDFATVERARNVAALASPKRVARQAENASKEGAEDAAVLQAVSERPGIPLRELATRVAALARCGRQRALVAVDRVRDRLLVVDGPRGAKLHALKNASV